ncbi:MAG: hypothetical protein KC505_00285 [Myxococcales bacterium]|nr:hypothetical protein [Myxococcales bacterium]USN51651.1 MAG: hypothetical protein H6731_04365 [Myxococcales bacterium]
MVYQFVLGILQDEPHDDDKKFSMVDLAMVHEYGSRDQNIPSRSFIRSTCDRKHKDHIRLLRQLQDKVVLGRLSKKQALIQFGEVVKSDMVQSINNGIEPALKPETIKRKGSSKPLIDHGILKGKITHEIRGGT